MFQMYINAVQTIFVVFYAVFWGAAMVAASKFKAFSTHLYYEEPMREKIVKRIIVSLLIMNVAPALLFALYVLVIFVDVPLNFYSLLAAAAAGMSVMGFPRILHGTIFSREHAMSFYGEKEWEMLTHDNYHAKPGWRDAHLMPGLLVVFGGFFVARVLLLFHDLLYVTP